MVRISGRVHKQRGVGEVTIESDIDDFIDTVESCLLGYKWIKADNNGGLQTHPAHEVPETTEDPEIQEFWLGANEVQGQKEFVYKQHIVENDLKDYQDSLFVQGLGGYAGKEKYKRNVATLTRWGFIQMRSKRGKGGRYWEIWYLPGAWSAQDELEGLSIEGIIRKVMNLGCGSITRSGVHWGLGVD